MFRGYSNSCGSIWMPLNAWIIRAALPTASSRVALCWRSGHDVLHLGFPHTIHNEGTRGIRSHIPMQLFNGAVARVSRAPVTVFSDQSCQVGPQS